MDPDARPRPLREAGARLVTRVRADRLLPILCVLWIAARFLPVPALEPTVRLSLESIRVRSSPITGRFEIVPDPDDAMRGVWGPRNPHFEVPASRLAGAVSEANDGLSEIGSRIAARVEAFPDRSAAFRVSGLLVPFYGRSAELLVEARDTAGDRPRIALSTIAEILETRLGEPRDDLVLEDTTRLRDLTRTVREIRDAIGDSGASLVGALDDFRLGASEIARRASGPFQRRGPGRILEIVLAAMIGAALHGVLRPRSPPANPLLPLTFAPALAAAVLLSLEGTPFLPVDPVQGLTLAFLPAALVIGYGGAAAFPSRVSRIETEVSAAAPSAERSPASKPVSPAGTPAPDSPAPRVAPAPPSPSVRESPARSEREVPEDPGLRTGREPRTPTTPASMPTRIVAPPAARPSPPPRSTPTREPRPPAPTRTPPPSPVERKVPFFRRRRPGS
jgi:hypothetical protein